MNLEETQNTCQRSLLAVISLMKFYLKSWPSRDRLGGRGGGDTCSRKTDYCLASAWDCCGRVRPSEASGLTPIGRLWPWPACWQLLLWASALLCPCSFRRMGWDMGLLWGLCCFIALGCAWHTGGVQ